ncbi:MAG: capsular polysaccharide biosynthesis protein [Myxococcales bacterium]|nr:capsular polysaccharide biosynthesis protein [Myxococcales bacterium]
MKRVATFSRGIAGLEHGPALIGCEKVVYRPLSASGIDAVVGWGHKGNTMVAIEFAHKHGLPYWRLEDGFLRSVGLGVEGDTALSMVMDDTGLYYDARRPSRLERILADDPLEDPAVLERADRAIAAIVEHGLSKYNNAPVAPVALRENGGRPRVLVVDQTAGDLSVACGLGKRGAFTEMLAAAHLENPDAEILIKTHPDVLSGKKHGYLGTPQERDRQRLISSPCSPIRLLEQVDKVYVVTSQLGFEALLVGKPVTCFGAPFYSGWGLTEDRRPVDRRGRVLSLSQLFAAAYIHYTRYVDPDSGAPCEIERVIEHLALQRQEFARNQGRIFCFGFIKHFWKQNYVRSYLRCPGNTIEFPYSAAHAEKLGFDANSKIVVWGRRAQDDVGKLSDKYGIQPWCMEDGFLRSVGLGSDMDAPASLVVDQEGIYFDPSTPSELESILQTTNFAEPLLEKARHLRGRLLASGLSKYNVGDTERSLPIEADDKIVVLVPGQVEDDASIQLGCFDIATNLGLLEAARAARPGAYIIFKPHPDVLSGNRCGNIPKEQALVVCDHVEEKASLAQCLRVANEVHVMTSLVGFEALLRGLDVHTYGQPFYSGWGLTTDRHPVSRRTRKLSLDALVAGTYLLYPRYLNRATQRFTSAFSVVDELETARATGAERMDVSWPRRQVRKLRHIASALAATEVRRGS